MKYFVKFKNIPLQETDRIKYYSLRRIKSAKEKITYSAGYRVARTLYIEK